MKVLILCNDFPPVNSIGAERPYSWYYYFKEQGITPVVITKNWNKDNNSRFTNVINETVCEETEKGIIIRVPEALTPGIWFRNKYGLRFSFLRKSLTFIGKILSFPFSFFDQHRNIHKEAVNYIINNNVDVIISTGEPFILFKYGYSIRKKYKIKWVADYRDGWYLNHVRSLLPDIGNKIIHKYEFYFEKKYLKLSDLITTVDPDLAKRHQNLLNKKTVVIYNGFWEFYENNEVISMNEKLILNHTGTLTIGQRVEFLLDVLVEMVEKKIISSENIEINFIGLDYFPEQANRVLKYNSLLDSIVKTTPRLPKDEAIKMNLKADLLINFTDQNFSAIYAKTYDYIACNRPILVIPGDGKMLDDLILQNNLGFVFDNKNSLLSFLVEKLNKHDESNFKSNESVELSRFRRKEQAIVFAEILKDLT